jgi:hypothetical protein
LTGQGKWEVVTTFAVLNDISVGGKIPVRARFDVAFIKA